MHTATEYAEPVLWQVKEKFNVAPLGIGDQVLNFSGGQALEFGTMQVVGVYNGDQEGNCQTNECPGHCQHHPNGSGFPSLTGDLCAASRLRTDSPPSLPNPTDKRQGHHATD